MIDIEDWVDDKLCVVDLPLELVDICEKYEVAEFVLVVVLFVFSEATILPAVREIPEEYV